MDDVVEMLEAEEARDFDQRLVAAVLKRAGELGELRLGRRDLLWLLEQLGTLDHIRRSYGLDFLEGLIIHTPAGSVPVRPEDDGT